MLCNDTNVAAANCHALFPVSSHFGEGTSTGSSVVVHIPDRVFRRNGSCLPLSAAHLKTSDARPNGLKANVVPRRPTVLFPPLQLTPNPVPNAGEFPVKSNRSGKIARHCRRRNFISAAARYGSLRRCQRGFAADRTAR
jgi:hypothetical protein